MKIHFPIINENLTNEFSITLRQYKDELEREILKLNIRREKVLSIVIFAINVFAFCLQIYSKGFLKSKKTFFSGLTYLYVILSIIALTFFFICYLYDVDKHKNVKFFKVIHLSLCTIILTICSFIAIYDESMDKCPYSFIAAAFCISALLYFNRIQRVLVFLISYFSFEISSFLTLKDFDNIYENLIYGSSLLIFVFILLGINYSSYVSNYINNKIISNKNMEIKNMYDIAEENLKKRTDELNATVEYEQLRNAFFANVSHELRTPLNVIFSAQQMIDYNLKKIDRQFELEGIRKYTNIIRQNCYRLIRLIGNFIDITKIDAGYLNIDFQNMNIVKVVEDITMSVIAYMEDKNINLTFDTDVEECIIACDPDKIERIILNLLSNAVKFTPRAGSIFVSIHNKPDTISISIKDTGIGIPDNMQKSIFERFVQVDKSISRCHEGSGIGLSIVKSLVEMHQGNIRLISKQGVGSEFVIEIPKKINTLIANENKCHLERESQNIERINIEFSDIYE